MDIEEQNPTPTNEGLLYESAQQLIEKMFGGHTREELVELIKEALAQTQQQAYREVTQLIEHDKDMTSCYEGCKCRQRLHKILQSKITK